MKLGKWIKRRWLEKHQKTAETPREVLPFSRVKTVGVLLNGSKSATSVEKMVATLEDFCQKGGLSYQALVYIPSKKLPDHIVPTAKVDYFCKKHMNVWGIPDKTAFGRFLNTPFDVLINAYMCPADPLHLLNGLSKASYRIGYTCEEDYGTYDVQVRANPKDEKEILEVVINQIKKF